MRISTKISTSALAILSVGVLTPQNAMFFSSNVAPSGASYYCRTVTIDHTKVPSTQSSFVVTVSGTYSYLATVANGGKVTSSSGYDIVAYSTTDCSGTKAAFTRPYWSATTGALQLRVLLTSVSSSSDTTFSIRYGDSTITTDQTDAATALAGFTSVYSLSNGSTLSGADEKGTNNGSMTGSPTATTGKVDGAANLVAASSQYIDVGTNASLDITGAMTIGAWIYLASSPASGVGYQIFSKDGSSGGRAYTFEVNNTTPGGLKNRFYVNGSSSLTLGSTVLSTGTWYHLVAVYIPDGTCTVYLNGASDGTATCGPSINTATASARIGSRAYSGFEEYFDGKIDEVFLIGGSGKAASWVQTKYNNENDPASFYTVGAEVAH